MRVKTNIKIGNKFQDTYKEFTRILKIAGDTVLRPRAVISESLNSHSYNQVDKST